MVAVFLLAGLWRITRVHVGISGVRDGVTLTTERAAALRVDIRLAQQDRLAGASLSFDGQPVSGSRVADGFHWTSGGGLVGGRHELVLTVPRPGARAEHLPVDIHRRRHAAHARGIQRR